MTQKQTEVPKHKGDWNYANFEIGIKKFGLGLSGYVFPLAPHMLIIIHNIRQCNRRPITTIKSPFHLPFHNTI